MLYYPIYNPQYDQRLIVDNVTFIWEGCWLWNKGTCSEGYGRFRYNGEIYRAHRYSYLCFIGDVPTGYLVRHICHNKRCCNPMHLRLGTDYDNWHDSENVHRMNHLLNRKHYIINGIEYIGCVETAKNIGLSYSTLIKYTDPVTRIFDVESYRNSCAAIRRTPVI